MLCFLDREQYWSMLSFLAILILAPLTKADYECVCCNDVERDVYSSASTHGRLIGFMFEFDCKPIAAAVPEQTSFYVVQFEKQVFGLTSYNDKCKHCLVCFTGRAGVLFSALVHQLLN